MIGSLRRGSLPSLRCPSHRSGSEAWVRSCARALTAVLASAVMAQGQGSSTPSRYVYVDGTGTSLHERVIAVLDSTTHEMIASLRTGVDASQLLGGLAANRAGTRVFVADLGRDALVAVNTATGAQAFRTTIAAPCCAVAMAGESRVLVAGRDGVAVIDAVSGAVLGTVPTRRSDGIATTGDGALAVVSEREFARVQVIDVAARQVLTTISVGQEPGAVAITPNGSRAIVANIAGSSLTVIDLPARSVLGTIALAGTPRGLAVDASGSRAIVSLNDADGVALVDVAGRVVLEQLDRDDFPFLSQPWGVAFTTGGAVVSDRSGRSVLRLGLSPLRYLGVPSWVGNLPALVSVSDGYAGPAQLPVPRGCTPGEFSLCLQQDWECRDDWDCGSAPTCDPWTNCAINAYRCTTEPRRGFRGCRFVGVCPACTKPAGGGGLEAHR